MPKGDVETYHDHGRWKNKIDSENGEVGTYLTREDAVAEGRNLARVRKVEHIIKKTDGTIGERNSYGHDPSDVNR